MDNKSLMKDMLAELSLKIRDVDFNGRDVVVWGAGETASRCEETFRRYGIRPICFVDSAAKKQGNLFFGHNVFSPDHLREIENPIVLISSGNIRFTDEIRSELKKMGLTHFTAEEYFFGKNAARLIMAADMLCDDRSVEVYCGIIISLLNNRLPGAGTVSENTYFVLPEFKKIVTGDVFVNLGAYKGEEIEKYLEYCKGKRFGKIVSFEPDKDSYAELLSFVDGLNDKWGLEEGRLQCVMAGAGDVTKRSFLISRGPSSMVGDTADEGGLSIDVYSLDDFMPNGRVDFIKADIEGFELRMLHGAKDLIIRNAPKIAVSIYHRPADYFEIIEYLSELVPEYVFSVRHHTDKFMDTVLYAYKK